MTGPQRENINRVIDAYCAKVPVDRSTLTQADAPTIAEAMGVNIYPNVPESIAAVLAGG